MQVIEELKRMSDERFLAIYQSLEQQGFGPLDGEVAKAMKFRPQAIRKLPMAQRARRARTLVQRASNAEVCYELFGSYLMKHHLELMKSFLDATGVAHEEGMIASTSDSVPQTDKIADAVAQLDQAHDPEDVTLYLAVCAEQWPGVAEIQDAWRARSSESAV